MTARSPITLPSPPTTPADHRQLNASNMPLAAPPQYPGAFAPLSREDVAGVLRISIRTLENWVKQGRLPPPASIGGRRYWHPERFYPYLEATLLAGSKDVPVASATQVAESAKSPDTPAAAKARRSSQNAAASLLEAARAKAQAAEVAPAV